MKMKAAILEQVNTPLVIEEVELDEPKAGEVLVKMVATGVCHTDLHCMKGDLATPPPVVLGHNTGALCSDWTPTEEGYDIEEVEAHHKHAYRLIYKVRNNKHLFSHLFSPVKE